MRGLRNFANNSTVHGINYIFDENLSLFDRFIWAIVVSGFGCVALYLVNDSYNTWQNNQVITALSTVAKPVTEVGFPAITICGTGQHLDRVEKILLNNFEAWKNLSREEKKVEDEFGLYMQEVFQISDRNVNILDILSTMILPEGSGTNAVRQNEVACYDKAKQKKRQEEGENVEFVTIYS